MLKNLNTFQICRHPSVPITQTKQLISNANNLQQITKHYLAEKEFPARDNPLTSLMNAEHCFRPFFLLQTKIPFYSTTVRVSFICFVNIFCLHFQFKQVLFTSQSNRLRHANLILCAANGA